MLYTSIGYCTSTVNLFFCLLVQVLFSTCHSTILSTSSLVQVLRYRYKIDHSSSTGTAFNTRVLVLVPSASIKQSSHFQNEHFCSAWTTTTTTRMYKCAFYSYHRTIHHHRNKTNSHHKQRQPATNNNKQARTTTTKIFHAIHAMKIKKIEFRF
jgi:hypothetical protein